MDTAWQVTIGQLGERHIKRHYKTERNARKALERLSGEYPDEPARLWKGTLRSAGYWSWSCTS